MRGGERVEVRGSSELRASGRRIEGLALPFGETCEASRCGRRERFERAAFDLEGLTWLDYEHDTERVLAYSPGGGLELSISDRGLELRTAELPAIPLADRALREIRSGKLRGLSVEFRSEAERSEGGIRVIERARLAGIGLVRDPAYRETAVEVRRTPRERVSRLWRL